MSRVVIADDHPIFRRGLAEVLVAAGHDVVGEAGDGEAAGPLLALADIAIVDINMPRLDGLALVRRAKANGASARFVVLSLHDENALVRAAFAAGADAYVLKDRAVEELLDAMASVSAGRRFVSGTLAGALLTGDDDEDADLRRLTWAELRVVSLLADELTSGDIAVRLGCSLRTVQNHRAHAVVKLDLSGMNRLLAYAVENRVRVRAFLDRRKSLGC